MILKGKLSFILLFWIVIIQNNFVFADELWDNAVEISKKNWDLYPGLIVTRSEMLKKDGTVKKYYEYWMKLIIENGEEKSEVIKVIKDGEDITEKFKKEQAEEKKEKKDEDSNSSGCDLFNPDEQDHLAYSTLSDTETVSNRNCVVYKFTKKRGKKIFTGKAWLELGTGIPVKVQYSQTPLEKGMKELSTTVYYEFESEGMWYVKRVIVSGKATLVIFTGRFRMMITFKDYKRKAE